MGQILSAREERRLVEELLEQDGNIISMMEPAQADEHLQDLVLQGVSYLRGAHRLANAAVSSPSMDEGQQQASGF